jgi:hypothetical protein
VANVAFFSARLNLLANSTDRISALKLPITIANPPAILHHIARFKMNISKRLVRVFCLFTTLVFMPGSQVVASTFFVTTTDDSIHPGSLRAAIIAANRTGGSTLIRLAGSSRGGSVYRLTIPGADEDSARTGDLDVTRGNVTIIGVGPNVTIDATGLGDRVFQVFSNAHLTLENLTIKGGSAPTGSHSFDDGESGGAIYNAGTLTLQRCTITDNASGPGQILEGNGFGTGSGDGGGIYNSGMLSAIGCQFIDNSSGPGVDGADGGNGGAIRNDGRCLLTACVLNGNRTADGGGPEGNAFGAGGSGGNGGAIYNTGTMILQNCDVSGNSGGNGASGGDPTGNTTIEFPGGWGGNGGSGGGAYNAGKIEFDYSSIFDNVCGHGGNGGKGGSGGHAGAGGSGAGLFNIGDLTLNTSTISGNVAGNGGNGGTGFDGGAANGGAGGNGGGIFHTADQDSGSNSLTLSSCTISLNVSGAGGSGGNDPGPFFLFNPTNAASGGSGGNGGGVWSQSTNAIIRNTLIAQNLVNWGGLGGTNSVPSADFSSPPSDAFGAAGTNGTGFDLFGNFTSQGFNLIGTADGSTGLTNGINADQVGTDASPIDPLLGPLQMNGGLTPTHALLPGSPAIDQGNSFGVHFDQRHDKRPNDLSTITNAPGGDGSDIGAFEFVVILSH